MNDETREAIGTVWHTTEKDKDIVSMHDSQFRAYVTIISQLAAERDEAVRQRDSLAKAADRADMQAWNLLAHEYGEHFRVADTDTSKWADKVRAFLAASSVLRAALTKEPRP